MPRPLFLSGGFGGVSGDGSEQSKSCCAALGFQGDPQRPPQFRVRAKPPPSPMPRRGQSQPERVQPAIPQPWGRGTGQGTGMLRDPPGQGTRGVGSVRRALTMQ